MDGGHTVSDPSTSLARLFSASCSIPSPMHHEQHLSQNQPDPHQPQVVAIYVLAIACVPLSITVSAAILTHHSHRDCSDVFTIGLCVPGNAFYQRLSQITTLWIGRKLA